MTLDGTKVRPNPGTLAYGGNQVGFTEAGVQLFVQPTWTPVQPEEFGQMPLDYVNQGGPVIAVAVGLQWDAALRAQLADYAISGNGLAFTTEDIGILASVLGTAALVFTPTTTGHVGWTAPRAVPLLGLRSPFQPFFQKRKEVQYGMTFGCLPPVGGGVAITIVET